MKADVERGFMHPLTLTLIISTLLPVIWGAYGPVDYVAGKLMYRCRLYGRLLHYVVVSVTTVVE